jgi:F-type H+-transporting ATPase subunit b
MIEKSLKEASEARELAQKTLLEVQSRLKNTDSEIEEILQAARKSGEKEKEAVIAEGEKLKEKIIEQAKANIDFELQKAKEKIKSDAALLALELAEKEIREKLGQKEQEALINDYIKRLEEKN